MPQFIALAFLILNSFSAYAKTPVYINQSGKMEISDAVEKVQAIGDPRGVWQEVEYQDAAGTKKRGFIMAPKPGAATASEKPFAQIQATPQSFPAKSTPDWFLGLQGAYSYTLRQDRNFSPIPIPSYWVGLNLGIPILSHPWISLFGEIDANFTYFNTDPGSVPTVWSMSYTNIVVMPLAVASARNLFGTGAYVGVGFGPTMQWSLGNASEVAGFIYRDYNSFKASAALAVMAGYELRLIKWLSIAPEFRWIATSLYASTYEPTIDQILGYGFIGHQQLVASLKIKFHF